MAVPHIIPANTRAGVPPIRWGKYKTAEPIVTGSVLALDGNGELILATSPITGATFHGIASHPANKGAGFNVSDDDDVIARTNREQNASYFVVDQNQEFRGTLVNNSATPVTPTQADIGVAYGLKAYNGIWCVDKAQTTTDACVTIVKIITDLPTPQVVFRAIDARIQAN